MFSMSAAYALRAMVYLAAAGGEPVPTRRIALATNIPGGYLAKVMRQLAVGGLVRALRGPSGGFSLARPAAEVSILDVVEAVGGLRWMGVEVGGAGLEGLRHELDGAMRDVERALRDTKVETLALGRARLAAG